MKILGIDPGTKRIGYGLIEKTPAGLKIIEANLFQINETEQAGGLPGIKKIMDALIDKFNPDLIGVEKLFFSKNQKTAMSVAEARGVIILSIAEHKIPFVEYTPNEIKTTCAGYGAADKQAVAKMVKISLHAPKLSVIDDVSDALAIALCAYEREKLNKKINGSI